MATSGRSEGDPLPRRTLRRLSWGIADQAASSSSNFAMGLFAARSLGAGNFGAFSLVFAVYTVALTASRAVNTEPLLVRHSSVDPVSWRRGTRRAMGASLLVGVVVGVACAFTGILLGGVIGKGLVALGATMPGLLLQDGWRAAFFAEGRGRSAFLNDIAWVVLMIPGLVFVVATGKISVVALVSIWGIGATGAALFGFVQSRVWPAPLRALAWWREQKDLAPRFLGEATALAGARQFVLFLIAGVAGLAAVGQLRAGLLILGPLNIVFLGLRQFAIPEAVRIGRRSMAAIRPAMARIAGGFIGFTLLWGLAMALLPEGAGVAVLHHAWRPARHLLLPLVIMEAAAGVEVAAVVGLRALAASRRTFVVRIVEAAITISFGAVGAAVSGALGAAWGLAAAYVLEGAIYWWQLRIELAGRASLGEERLVAAAPVASFSAEVSAEP